MIRPPPRSTLFPYTTLFLSLGASTPNTYDITYSFGTAPCTGTATSQVTVSAQPTATVSGGTFCATGTTTLADRKSVVEGKRANLAGRRIIKKKRVKNLGGSTPNTYNITE